MEKEEDKLGQDKQEKSKMVDIIPDISLLLLRLNCVPPKDVFKS